MNVYNLLELTKEKLKQIDSKEKLIDVCDFFFKNVEIDYFMFCICDSTSLIKPNTIVIDNFPKEWCKIYFERNFQKIDPITDYCLLNVTPIYWHDLIKLEKYKKPAYKAMFSVAKELNLNSGVSIPFTTVKGDKGMLSLVSELKITHAEKILNRIIPFAMLLLCYLADCIYSNNWLNYDHVDKHAFQLTKREYNCLLWASEGKTSWEISKILGITERTVLFHMNNVIKKFGVNNRQHAVAKGIIKKIILPKFDHLV